jgi:C_GCAxxG_C_C family probable redox protein
MKSKSIKAEECFSEGFNCCQAVLSAFSSDTGLNREKAMKIASGFGAGMAYMGETCGAVTGAFMVFGLMHGRSRVEDTEAKEKTYRLMLDFVKEFVSKNGTIKCSELLGEDISTTEGLKKAYAEGKLKTVCPKVVRDAAAITEQLRNE